MTETVQPVPTRISARTTESVLADARLLIEPTQRVVLESLPAEVRQVAGGRARAESEGARHRSDALDALAAAEPDPSAAADLHTLAELITSRVS